MRPRSRRRLRLAAAFAAWFVVLWLLWTTPVVYPLKLFVVLLHELGHAAAALATGGEVRAIVVTADEGGLCRCPGGNAFLTLSAGYLGSLGWGALLFVLGMRAGRWTRVVTGTIGVAVVALTLLYVRNVFGFGFGVVFGVALVASARALTARTNGSLLAGLGLTSCLYAILDIKSDILDRPHLPSDASLLADLTGVPTAAWGILWILIAAGVCWALVRWTWRRA